MSRNYTDEDYKKFAQVYIDTGNQAQAARAIGVSEGSSKQRGSELVKRPQVQKYISQLSILEKNEMTDAVGSIEDIFEAYGSGALAYLGKLAQTDPAAADKFIKHKREFEKLNKEELGEFSGHSTRQLLDEVDNCIKELQDIKDGVMEAIRTGEMSE